ncbi:MAG: hypothetical protein NTW32_22585 [Chloroflexi bacterium]|nr:hypothetical protein [Chloroflexota bacterium]
MNKKGKHARTDSIILPRRLREGLYDADVLLTQDKPQQALELLQELDQKFPRQPDLLGLMVNAYLDVGDQHGYLLAIHKLHELTPNQAEAKLGLAGAYLANGFIALALQTFRQYTKRWPNSERTGEIQKTIQQLEKALTGFLSEIGFSLDIDLDFASKHEELRLEMEQGNYNRCRQLAKFLFQKRPNFVPALNTLSLIEWLDGNLPGAIELSHKVLENEPDNVHALSNLTRFFFMLGRKDEAITFAKRLSESDASAADRWLKKAEALSFIGDNDGVLSILEQAKHAKEQDTFTDIMWHLCAVAEYRNGNFTKARRYWQKSAQASSNSTLAITNLEELMKPLYERVCPQVFPLDSWISRKTIVAMASEVERASRHKINYVFHEKVNVFLDSHPELIQFVPEALSSGDVKCRELALQLADMSAHPKILLSLKEFVLSQNGPDALRLEGSQILSRYNIFHSGEMIRLWLKGSWAEIMMIGFQISRDAEPSTLKQSTLRLMEKAINAFHANNAPEAEVHLRKALEIQGDDPGLLNNLAMALQMQGKQAESDSIADQIPTRFPDYFFGQVITVRRALKAKQLEKAKITLDKMMTKPELHVTEFSALCACQIDFFLANEKPEGAISWYEMWEQGYPDDTNRENYQTTMTMIRAFSKLAKGFTGRGRKEKATNSKND